MKSFWKLVPLVAAVCWMPGSWASGSCAESALCCRGRDSSCVVQKTPVNAIIEDLNDKPCYCDHACLKLNDCCQDYRQTCGVRDCEVSDWAEWSDCDSDCGPGSQSRKRHVVLEPRNGGKGCPSLTQKRACQGSKCVPNNVHKAAAKETAMLLPSSFGASRRANETHDIRKNLRLRHSKNQTLDNLQSEYCLVFEVTKASKACHKDKDFTALREDVVVCVRCESGAMRRNLGYRCSGQGLSGQISRWSALTNNHCHGKWLRRPETSRRNGDCPCEEGASYIFV